MLVALLCIVDPQCKITAEKQDNRKCIFAKDGIPGQNSIRRTFKFVATVTCLIVPRWCFCGVKWLFIHVIYIKCLGFWLERKDNWKKKVTSIAMIMMTNFWIWHHVSLWFEKESVHQKLVTTLITTTTKSANREPCWWLFSFSFSWIHREIMPPWEVP